MQTSKHTGVLIGAGKSLDHSLRFTDFAQAMPFTASSYRPAGCRATVASGQRGWLACHGRRGPSLTHAPDPAAICLPSARSLCAGQRGQAGLYARPLPGAQSASKMRA
jgi:hypothetical protein